MKDESPYREFITPKVCQCLSSKDAASIIRLISMLFLFQVGILDAIWGQSTSPALIEHQEAYDERILKERLNGHYIPVDVEDALKTLNQIAAGPAVQRALALDEEVFVKRLFFGFGRWMTINWSFYEGSRLSHHLRSQGLSHPDDMTKAMMIWFYRRHSEAPLQTKELISTLRKEREKARKDPSAPAELQRRN